MNFVEEAGDCSHPNPELSFILFHQDSFQLFAARYLGLP